MSTCSSRMSFETEASGEGIERYKSEPQVRMPQATNMKVMKEKEFSPVGPGTMINHVLQISAATRERAKLINKTEESRLLRLQNLIEKERRFAGNLQNRVIRKTSKSLTERRALLDLLENEYKVKNFITMKPKFDPGSIDNVKDARRYVIESRVFNSGFNLKSMKPEVRRKIRMLDPIHKYKVYKKKLLADNWQQNVEINRAISDSTFNMMLSDRKHWREYNFPPGHPRWQKSEEIKTSSKEASRSRKSSQIPALVNDEIQQVREVNTFREEVESDRTKEKSVVLERRQLLPRNPNAFSMSMRSLGPVYFQTTVSTLPVLQNTL